jgi:hypothetical protein
MGFLYESKAEQRLEYFQTGDLISPVMQVCRLSVIANNVGLPV